MSMQQLFGRLADGASLDDSIGDSGMGRALPKWFGAPLTRCSDCQPVLPARCRG